MKHFARLVATDFTRRIVMVVHRDGEVWNFPGGKIEPGENQKTAAIREAREEAGLDIADATFLHQGIYRFGDELWHGHYFHAEIGFQLPLNCEPEKFTAVALYTEEQIRQATTERFVLDAIEALPRKF